MKKKILCFIPAKGRSTGFKNKNLKKIKKSTFEGFP
jgi:CMP-N-acetylneuraminic acid synthetase